MHHPTGTQTPTGKPSTLATPPAHRAPVEHHTATLPTHDDHRPGSIGKWETSRPVQVDGVKQARRTMQRLTDSERLKGCGVRPIAGAAEVTVDHAGEGHARLGKLQTCKSRWLCPVCAPRIAGDRAEQLAKMVTTHVERGGAVAMVTLTIPHFWPDSLGHLMEVTKAAWGRLTSDKAWKGGEGIRARYGVTLPPVWALEVTHGSQGWHPHRHVLLFLDRSLSSSALEALESELFDVWARVVVKAGGRRPSAAQGVDVRQSEQVEGAAAMGAYVAKGDTMKGGEVEGVANEVMRGAMKQARRGGRTPLQILSGISAAYEAGEEPVALDLRIWKEWEEFHLEHVTRQVHVPKALEELLEVEQVDEAAAASEDSVNGKRLEWTSMVGIPALAWREYLAHNLELQAAVLAAARGGDLLASRLAVVGVLERAGVPYRVMEVDLSPGVDMRAWRTDVGGARAVLEG